MLPGSTAPTCPTATDPNFGLVTSPLEASQAEELENLTSTQSITGLPSSPISSPSRDRSNSAVMQRINEMLGGNLNMSNLSTEASTQNTQSSESIMSSLSDIIGLNTPVRNFCESTFQNQVSQTPVSLTAGVPGVPPNTPVSSLSPQGNLEPVGSRRSMRSEAPTCGMGGGQLEDSQNAQDQTTSTPLSHRSRVPSTLDMSPALHNQLMALLAAQPEAYLSPALPVPCDAQFLPASIFAGNQQTPILDSDTSSLVSPSNSSYLGDLLNRLNLNQSPPTAPPMGMGMGMNAMSPISGFSSTPGSAASAASFAASPPVLAPVLQPVSPFEEVQQQNSDWRNQMGNWNHMFTTSAMDPQSIDRAAKLYRNAANVCDANCTWSGQLPPRNHKNPIYSCKVFVGGVPWDVTEATLTNAFRMFGGVHVEWPGREARYSKNTSVRPTARGKGYVYIIFENEKSVKSLLANCSRDFSNSGDWYFKLTTRRMRTKEIRQVQIIPWVISDSTYVRCNNQRMDPQKTVFVGALHGMMTAEALGTVMNDLFGGVVYSGIDTDKYKYPIGSGRVTFNNMKSYIKAVNAAFVEVKTTKFTKKIQIDPYLEDSPCSMCQVAAGPYFCRELMCYRYFCKSCWQNQHRLEVMHFHKPLMRNTRVLDRKRHESLGFESDGSGSGTGSSFGNEIGGDLSPNHSPELQSSTRAELSFLSVASNGNQSESMELPANGIGMTNGACSSSILSAYGNSIFGGL